MDQLRVMVFDQTQAPPGTLGPWHRMETSWYQIVTALGYPVGARHQPQDRSYTVHGDAWRSVTLPLLHDFHWNDELPGERRLDDPEAELKAGRAVQVFIFNGDSDCVRHYLLLPLPAPVSWLP